MVSQEVRIIHESLAEDARAYADIGSLVEVPENEERNPVFRSPYDVEVENSMKFKLMYLASILITAAVSARADTLYNITFTDTTSSPDFSNATGTFTVNGAGMVTSMNVSFTVVRAFTFQQIPYNVGDVLVFNTATDVTALPGLPTYDPTSNTFTTMSVTLDEQPATDPNKGAHLFIGGARSGNIYGIGPLVDGEFTEQPDSGVYTITPTATPEPATAGLFLLPASALALLAIRKRFI